MIEALLYLVIYIIVVGVVLWLLHILIDRVPMEPTFKQIAKTVLLVIGVIILIVLLLNFLGVIGPLPRLGR